ncbi:MULTISPECIES: hypothetical protein [unclassified Agrococcus]|uniref:hypothetical protein n=1 Tax=unclassified Agrococcus TaxID=2615065 RepID=UPI003617BE01
MINIRNRESGVHVVLPAPNRLPANVGKALEALIDAEAALKGAQRERDGLVAAVQKRRDQAQEVADAAVEAGDDPPKGLLAEVRAAEEAAEEAAMLWKARRKAFRKAADRLAPVLEANRSDLIKRALKDAEQGVKLLASARLSAEEGRALIEASHSILGLFLAAGDGDVVQPRAALPVGSKATFNAGAAVGALTEATASANAETDGLRRVLA